MNMSCKRCKPQFKLVVRDGSNPSSLGVDVAQLVEQALGIKIYLVKDVDSNFK